MSSSSSLPLLPHRYEQAAKKVDAAAEKAIQLIRRYAESDHQSSESNNVWNHPDEIKKQLSRARDEVTNAWRAMEDIQQQQKENNKNTNTKTAAGFNDVDFRAAYIDMVTDAFADVLDELRNKEGDELDVDILVDCLQSGIDFMTQEDKEIFMFGDDYFDGDDEEKFDINGDDSDINDDILGVDEEQLTPHEIRRRELGFHHPADTAGTVPIDLKRIEYD